MNTIKWMCGLALVAGMVVLAGSCAPITEPTPPTTPEGPKVQEEIQIPPTLVPVDESLRQRVQTAIRNVQKRDLRMDHGFWTIFHGILGLGPGVRLVNPETGERVNAVEYICNGGELPGLRFNPTPHGLDVQIGPSMVGQGHQDQFVAEMIQWGMPLDRTFKIGQRDYTFRDFVNHSRAKASVAAKQELGWAIIVIGTHFGTDHEWTNAKGEHLHLEDLLRYEVEAPVEEAACGGTHRLFGLSWVYHLHLQKGGKTEGVWKQIADRTAEYCDKAKKLQNPDGAFSTSYFRGKGDAPDKQLRISTTGHTVEWLALALDDQELREQWMQDAVNALSMLILDTQGAPIEGAALYHAVHGLFIYHARVFDRSICPPELTIPLRPGWKIPK
jgi:hypothetical protein